MRVAGYDLSAKMSEDVRIPRQTGEIVLKVEAFPFGFDVDDWLPLPKPPRKIRRDPAGRVVKGPDGQPLYLEDDGDLEFRRAYNRTFWLRIAAFFWRATLGHVQWQEQRSEVPAEHAEAVAFFQGIRDEIEAAGLSAGDVLLVVNAARRLSNMDIGAIERVQADFSPPGVAT